MQYLQWIGTLGSSPWGDLGSPGDRPTEKAGGQVTGIMNFAVWGDGLDVYTIFGTSDADVVFLDIRGLEDKRLINVKQINGGDGNDLIDMTSTRFKYGAVTLNGGNGNDALLGNAGSDILLGGAGRDQLKGYGGNDYLSGGNNNDRLLGGRGDDRLVGGSGNDYLVGQFGKDTLTGGSGQDRFAFEVSPIKANIDRITDFSVKDDSVYLARSIFTKAGPKGTLKSKAFWNGSEAHDADDRIIYNKKTGYLYYDPDGTGDASQHAIAKVSKNLAMTHKDFLIF
ncbi:Ca2+-binding RTX toxin-like protein [Microvirga flocculans]|uniref:Ca2+-binding RTX toxin-like protein n=1 Tax=Microvirga flocculans TaxID=217168 RepID=A0A7W6IFY2_9HYPH|nr:calcium-binding protein [Microvirga flocculans]MBB4040790.1 Ca2+-binding RTX toxin-like protein [Microvirga flocculans]